MRRIEISRAVVPRASEKQLLVVRARMPSSFCLTAAWRISDCFYLVQRKETVEASFERDVMLRWGHGRSSCRAVQSAVSAAPEIELVA